MCPWPLSTIELRSGKIRLIAGYGAIDCLVLECYTWAFERILPGWHTGLRGHDTRAFTRD